MAGLKRQLTEGGPGKPAYMLRRLKSEALEGMPTKHIHTASVEMPLVQAAAYRDLVLRAAAAASDGNTGKGSMLSTLAALRGISLHPLDPRQAPTDLGLYARDSARLGHTLGILDKVAAQREKALIFVEDLAMQERLAGLIQARFGLPAAPMRINGSVPGPKRQAMVTSFQQGRDRFDVMILSPKAGGVGLTLTSANHVIHLSRWWNPAVEDQATDRVFRIGQGKDVHVHLPLAAEAEMRRRRTAAYQEREKRRYAFVDLIASRLAQRAKLASVLACAEQAGDAEMPPGMSAWLSRNIAEIDALLSPLFLEISARRAKIDFDEAAVAAKPSEPAWYYPREVSLELWELNETEGNATLQSSLEWALAQGLIPDVTQPPQGDE